jgi:hypothetical protein
VIGALTTVSSDGGSGLADVVIVLVVAGLAYVVTWYIWPYSPCRRCDGAKRLFSPTGGGTWRTCSWCDGSGTRMRTGRQIIGLLSRSDRERGMH